MASRPLFRLGALAGGTFAFGGFAYSSVPSSFSDQPAPWWMPAGWGAAAARVPTSWPLRMEVPTAMCAGGATVQAGHVIPSLPTYTLEEIAKNNGKATSAGTSSSKSRVWVTYKAGVYDVTDFIEAHPGGSSRIKLASGSAIDPFWERFRIHNSDEVRKILEGMRIGNVAGYVAPPASTHDDAWKNEPKRHPALVVRSKEPFNAETPKEVLAASGITSGDLFFIRNHMPVPVVDPSTVETFDSEPAGEAAETSATKKKSFCLRVEGDGLSKQCLTIRDLETSYHEHTITTSIQCGGNRRTETPHRDKVKGLAWECGAIGTAEWTGVFLRDIIESAARFQMWDDSGDSDALAKRHVKFEGLDGDDASKFEVSIPLKMAVDKDRDVLIAYKMNGQPIPRDHGYPLRAIVPGVVGVRNCKWLGKITVTREESQSDWQQRDYKNFPPWLKSPAPGLESIYDMPVQSAITEIERDPSDDDFCKVTGFAYVGGGRGIQRVEMSVDGGKNFTSAAELSDGGISQPEGKRWAWHLFQARVKVPTSTTASATTGGGAASEAATKMPICCRAITNTQDTQPPVASVNFRGLLNNGYSCVAVPPKL